MRKTTLFKQLLNAPEIPGVPVAHDRRCAKIIERAGFKVVGCAGYANSAALIVSPDVELAAGTPALTALP
jgi:2,3-dimethylmalate lyase